MSSDQPARPDWASDVRRDLEALAKARGLVNARVRYKRSEREGHVLAIIFEGMTRDPAE